MNQINWLDVFNSATTFGILSVIAITLLILVSRKDAKSKPKSSRHP